MSEIRKGDLVMVVRGHGCLVMRVGGVPFRVDHINPPCDFPFRCSGCDRGNVEPPQRFVQFNQFRIPLSYLKKIDPLSEPEAEVYREERVTPASKPEVAVSKSKRVSA